MDSISPHLLELVAGPLPHTAAAAQPRPSSLRRLTRLAQRWRWVLIGATLGGLITGLLATLLMQPLYASTARLEIARESARVTKIDSVERETSIGDQEFYQTQYGLLVATALAQRVARDLNLVDDPAFFRQFGRADQFARYGAPLADPAMRAKRNEIAGKILLEHVGIAPVRGSSLVDVTALTPDPPLTQKIAQVWSRDFIETNLERRFEASDYARKFLEGRIEDLRGKLETSERSAVGYASAQGIIDLPMPGAADDASNRPAGSRSLLTDDLATLNTALAAATAERIAANARLSANRAADASDTALANPALAQLRQQRAAAAGDLGKLQGEFGPTYAPVQAAQAQLVQIDRAIAAETDRVRQSLAQSAASARLREDGLRAKVDALKSTYSDMQRRGIQYTIYQRDAETNRQLYNSLLQRYKEIGVAGGIESNNVAVVNAAELPDRPSRPNLLVNLLLGLVAGIIAGIATVAVLNQIDEGLTDPDQVAERLGLPLLGIAPNVSGEDPAAMLEQPRSALVEGYLAVQANLELSTPQGTPRALAITSTRAREGKSMTALALARSLARAGRNVVLIDADMRSPSVHLRFGLPDRPGLSNWLAAGGDLETLLQPTPVERLSVITAGPLPPNAADLLTGTRLHDAIEALTRRFDHVLVDCPPVLGLADAPLVTAAVDRVIYVVEARTIPAAHVRGALDRLAMAQANLLGVVLTKYAPKPGQGTSYDYGYGYGEATR